MKSMKAGAGDSADSSDHKPIKSGGSGFKVTDGDEWPADDSDMSGGDSDDSSKKVKSKKKKGGAAKKLSSKNKRGKGEDDDDYDSDPGEESDGKQLLS